MKGIKVAGRERSGLKLSRIECTPAGVVLRYDHPADPAVWLQVEMTREALWELLRRVEASRDDEMRRAAFCGDPDPFAGEVAAEGGAK